MLQQEIALVNVVKAKTFLYGSSCKAADLLPVSLQHAGEFLGRACLTAKGRSTQHFCKEDDCSTIAAHCKEK